MDIKEYIASGVVELYAMGTLSSEEKKEFEQKMLIYPEVATELKIVQEALENYVLVNSRNPRPSLRAEIIASATESESDKMTKSKVRKMDSNHKLTYKYLIAASLAALLISTFASWFFYKNWNDAEDRYVSALNEKNQIALNYNLVKNTFEHTYSDLMLMRDENAKVMMLMPVDSTKHFQARVYWNKYSRETYIDILSLPDPGEGKQYQLWALTAGNPVDAGIFILPSDAGMQRLKNIIEADQWAVTIEPTGGSLNPSLDQMILVSKNS